MPSNSLNQNWDIEDPNAEIPHLPENAVHEEELKDSARKPTYGKGSEAASGEAVHVENSSKGWLSAVLILGLSLCNDASLMGFSSRLENCRI